MADNLESIGGVSVQIVGDYSDLQADFSAAQSMASTAGTEIADAFTSGAEGAAGSATNIADSLAELTRREEDVGEAAETAAAPSGDFLKTLLEFSGLSLSIAALGQLTSTAIELSGTIEKATISITALSGDAAGAAAKIEELKRAGDTFGVSFESLLSAQQKFSAFGVSLQESSAAMHAAIEAAAALNSNVETTASSIDRIAISGMAGSRQLLQLGLTTKDLAEAMGIAASQVKIAFANMGESERLNVVEQALSKFKGTAEAAAESFPAKWQTAKNQFNEVLASMGSLLEKSLIGWADAYNWIKDHSWGKISADDIAKLEQQAQNSGLQFSKLTAQFQLGTVSAKDYCATLENLIAAHNNHAKAVQDSTDQVHNQTDAVSVLRQILEDAKTELAAITPAYQLGQVGATQYQAAIKAVESAQKEYNTALEGGKDSVYSLTDNQNKLTTAWLEAWDTYQKVNASYRDGTTLINGQVASLQMLATAIQNVDKAAKAADQEGSPAGKYPFVPPEAPNPLMPSTSPTTGAAVQTIGEVPPEVIDSFVEAKAGISAYLETIKEAPPYFESLEQILAKMHISFSELDSQTLHSIATFNMMATATEHVLSGIGSAFVNVISSGQNLQAAWHELWTSMAKTILDTVMQAIEKVIGELVIVQVLMSFFSGVGSGAKILGSMDWGSLLPTTTPLIPQFAPLIPQFAEGGMVPYDTMALVHGGEYISPSSQVAAGNYGPAGGAGPQIYMTVTMNGATRDLVDDVMDQMVKAGRRAGVKW